MWLVKPDSMPMPVPYSCVEGVSGALGRVGGRAPSSTHALSFLQMQGGPVGPAAGGQGENQTALCEHRRQCAQCAGTREGPSRGRDWQRPAAPGARRSSPPPHQTKSGLGLGSWRPSRHLGRLGGPLQQEGGGFVKLRHCHHRPGRGLATREQEAGLEGVRDDDKEAGGAAAESPSWMQIAGGDQGFLRGPQEGRWPPPNIRDLETLAFLLEFTTGKRKKPAYRCASQLTTGLQGS